MALLGLLGAAPSLARPGMEITVLRPFPSLVAERGPILTCSFFTPRILPMPGFDELGAVWLPAWEGNQESVREGVREFAGMVAGHLFLPLQGWVRPGVHFGWTWQKSVEQNAEGMRRTREGFSFYYGAKVQVSCLTFALSNKGIGGGINFSL